MTVLIFLLSPVCRADEFYGLQLEGNCGVEIGVITRIESGTISLLRLNGDTEFLPADKIKKVFVFNSIESPVPAIQLSEPLAKQLKSVYVGNLDQPGFYGWPIRFIDNLIVFMDVLGNSQVYDQTKILKIKTPGREEISAYSGKSQGKEFSFDLHEFFPLCQTLNAGFPKGELLRPTRILADEIRARQFLDDLERGYDALENLQERTRFYARPFLYQEKARLGFLFLQNKHEVHHDIPAYLLWANGRPFRFQSSATIGAHVHELLPNLEPEILVETEAKAHFFHIHFSGNLFSFSAGSSYFKRETEFGVAGKENGLAAAEAQNSFNYVALMGADYGPFSVSAGKYYPVYGIRYQQEVREILAHESSPLYRLMYTGQKFKIQAVFSPNVTRDINNPGAKDIKNFTRVVGSRQMELPSRLIFAASFWKVNAEYQILKEVKAGISLFDSKSAFREWRPGSESFMDSRRRALSVSASQEFGDYISLSIFWNNSWNHLNGEFYGASVNGGFTYSQLGGKLEFLF